MKNLKSFRMFESLDVSDLDFFWDFVNKVNYKSDNDYGRVSMYLVDNYSKEEIKKLEKVYRDLHEDLYNKYKDDWLGEPGINASDDSWNDLRADVISRGERFYNNINLRKLQLMADMNDYSENFGYSFQID